LTHKLKRTHSVEYETIANSPSYNSIKEFNLN